MPGVSDNTPSNIAAAKNSKTFRYTGGEQKFVVPKGVTQLTVVAHGGEGAGFSPYLGSGTPGHPGRVKAIIPVRPGDKLYIFVGGSGSDGGFNGGGAGGVTGSGSYAGNPGGGASDVRIGTDRLKDRIIVAAGGGGAGSCYLQGECYGQGGDGGGLDGKSGGSDRNSLSGKAGGGGTQSAGGSGGSGGHDIQSGGNGTPGGNGAVGNAGSGGNGAPPGSGYYYDAGYPGGGGGGGYYGGGGGGGSAATGGDGSYLASQGAGGGGGSSYVEASAIASRMWTGWRVTGDGQIIFSW